MYVLIHTQSIRVRLHGRVVRTFHFFIVKKKYVLKKKLNDGRTTQIHIGTRHGKLITLPYSQNRFLKIDD